MKTYPCTSALMKTYWRAKIKLHAFLINPGIRWRRLVSFTLLPLYLRGNEPPVPTA
jgi:hypothetical protein